MSKLYILAGAAGVGKSWLLTQIRAIDTSFKIIQKLTTRERRKGENPTVLDLIHGQSRKSIEGCDYRYQYKQWVAPYDSYWYGIKKVDIDVALSEGKNPIVIVRRAQTIRQLREDYPKSIVIYVQSALSAEKLIYKLKDCGRDDLKNVNPDEYEKQQRMMFHDYISFLRPILFNHVLINYFEEDSFIEQFESILQIEKDRAKSQFNIKPLWGNKPRTVIESLIFVLMPFNEKWSDSVWELLQRAIGDLGMRVERADQKKGRIVMSDIWEGILRANVVIADLTNRNPNVTYEVGLADVLGKEVILLSQTPRDVPFDFLGHRLLIYDNTIGGEKKLKKDLANRLKGVFG